MNFFKKKKKEENVLVSMWRNWNLCALLVGMYNGAAAVQNSTAVPQKIKTRITIRPSNPTSGCIPERIESRDLKRYLYTHFNTIIHNSQEVEATQRSISR